MSAGLPPGGAAAAALARSWRKPIAAAAGARAHPSRAGDIPTLSREGGKMSAGDVVCTGWLIKSPPEKKLKRYAWRKRWFILRRGRMSGNPDVLEYYKTNSSKKPIRVIDLNECEVQTHSGLSIVKKEFQNHFVFIVKTTFRTFYLVAKTEEEMLNWVQSISRICNFGHLDDGTDSLESVSHTTSSLQPSPAVSIHTSSGAEPSYSTDSSATGTPTTEENTSESGSIFLPDYLFLSNCETGKLNNNRSDSLSTSDKSLEQTSSDDVFLDAVQSQASLNFLPSLYSWNTHQDVLQTLNHAVLPKDGSVNGLSEGFSSSSPLLSPSLAGILHSDKKHTFGVSEGDIFLDMPPPRPPKPSHFSEGRSEHPSAGLFPNGIGASGLQAGSVPRRISLSSLDNVRNWKADFERSTLRSRDKRLSLNLPRFAPIYSCTAEPCEDSYVPMKPNASPPISESDCTPDGYIPMSPVSPPFALPVANYSKVTSPLPELPADLEPPPVNRDLKPRTKSRPPPLDLRSLTAIQEHPALTRTWTVPYNRTSFISPEKDCIGSARMFASSCPAEEDESCIEMWAIPIIEP
ncbi:GRB2-associated-binding protein 3 isoform X2 [Ambystoma mexicanum]|uniref:GRB2-associated-binding protein 3 isoform X2 n=1 Tax=Ambystoma mexicanum TaxID=8296 RepID=UPI0037E8434F